MMPTLLPVGYDRRGATGCTTPGALPTYVSLLKPPVLACRSRKVGRCRLRSPSRRGHGLPRTALGIAALAR